MALASTALVRFAVGMGVALPAAGLLSIETTPALADGGAGGHGDPGGADSATGAGGAGSAGNLGSSGGGGGGAGLTGGAGGSTNDAAGGAGATSASAPGGNAASTSIYNDYGGGGGGGGANGYVGAAIPTSSPVAGSAGGNGGDGINGGGGGAGGWGAVITGGGNLGILTVTATGGNGGNGGTGYLDGGSGGSGGIGLALTGSSPTLTINQAVTGGNGGSGGAYSNGGAGGSGIAAATGSSLTINAAVTGGAGGGNDNGSTGNGGAGITGSGSTVTIGAHGSVSGGAAQAADPLFGTSGTSGAGISGSDLTVINAGSIAGGIGANAITFTAGSNILELQAGSTISGNVVGTGADMLRFGGATNAGFDVSQIGQIGSAAQYQGFSTFDKTGASTWTLTGTNTAVMPWTIDAGGLQVNGSLTGSTFTVNSGGTLGGTGTIGTATVNSGGTFAPGAAGTPGTSTTVSSLFLRSGAIYLVQVNPATASLANVTGTATLTGNVLAAFATGSYLAKQYTILHSAGLGGTTFSALGTTNLPSGFAASLSYTSTDVLLNLTAVLGTTGTIGTTGLGGNQRRVANALNNFFNNGGSLLPSFLTVFGLSGGSLSGALSQLSGAVGGSPQQVGFNAMTQFLGVLTDPVAGHGGGLGGSGGLMAPMGYAEEGDQSTAYASRRTSDAFAMFTKAPAASDVPRWSVWASAFGGGQSITGNAGLGTNDTTSRIAGAAVGADYRFSPDTLTGFALAGGGTSFGVSNLGSGRSDLFQAGTYARHDSGPAYATAALAYGWQDVTTSRNVTVAGLDVLQARFDANTLSGRLESGYRFVVPVVSGLGVTPYAAGQFTTIWLPSYAEQAVTGTNVFALAYGAHAVTDPRSELGLRTDKSYALPGAVLTLRGREAWMHDYDPDPSVSAAFATLPGASFVVNGAAQPRDAWLSTAEAEVKFASGWSLLATLDSEWAPHATGYAGKGSVRYQW